MVVNTVQTFDSPIDRLRDADTSLFFTTENDQLGVSDGTQAGTSILNSDGDGEVYFGLNGNVFFDGFSSENGEEPFVNNGTADGTSLLLDIELRDSETSDPSNFFAVGDIVYFTAFNQENGIALYSSDGTPEGTSLVADIDDESSRFSTPFTEFTDFNGALYFEGDERENGHALWRSDGTTEGTEVVSRFESSFINLNNLTAAEENLYFTRSNELWVSDGNTEGTELIFDNLAIQSPVAVENSIYFTADSEGNTGQELWISDGTTEGTRLVEDIRPEERVGGSPRNLSSSPENLTEVGGRLFFTADDGQNGEELWLSDGTTEGTRLVLDITEGENSSQLSDFTEVNGKLYFIKDDNELWQSEGTIATTFRIEQEIDLGGTTTPSFQNLEQLIEYDDQLYIAGESFSQEEGVYVPALLTQEDSDTVFRLRNPTIGNHFYTTSAAERDEAIDSGEFDFEGESFTAVDPTSEGAEEVYRFFNESQNVYLYTTNENERDFIQENDSRFTFQGEVFNAYETQVEGSIPIYRFLNTDLNVHFYTPNAAERDFVEETLPNYQSEGIAYYALPLEDA